MSPAIDEGDIVIASQAGGNIDTAIYLVRIKGSNERLIRTVTKRDDGILLAPINEKHPTRFVAHEDVEEYCL